MCIGIDHIVVTAPTLDSGAKFLAEAIGATADAGGEHERMSTHNLLLRLGDASYLEILAPNPNRAPPDRPRWFEVDQTVQSAQTRVATWAARVGDIGKVVAQASEDIGNLETMSRGPLTWSMTIPPDGRLVLDGVGPALIAWPGNRHPASAMPDRGYSLVGLDLFHPDPPRVRALLQSLGLEGVTGVFPTRAAHGYISARILTPHGERVLASPPAGAAPL